MLKKIPRSLIALSIGGFGIGLTEFVIMGLLPDVAKAMNVTIPEAGHYIAAYALGVVVGAPLLVSLGRTLAPKNLLLLLMVIFTVFNGLSALAPGSLSLLALRFLSGLPHGAYFGVAAVVAGRIAGPGKAASAFAVVLGGLTICNIIGVPIATTIGHMVSWRASFALVALVGILTLLTIRLWVPEFEADSKGSLKDDLKIFKKSSMWFAIAIASIGFGGFFAWFSYITPMFTTETGFDIKNVPYLLSLAGLGMTVGNWAGGKLADSYSPIKAVICLTLMMTVILLINAFSAQIPFAMIILTFLTGATAMAMGAPIQMVLIESSHESPILGASIGQSAFNMGNSLGAFLGGFPLIAGYGYTSPLYVGAGLSFTGMLIALRLKQISPVNH